MTYIPILPNPIEWDDKEPNKCKEPFCGAYLDVNDYDDICNDCFNQAEPEKVKILNTDGLDDKTKIILSKECYFIKEYIENETLFFEIKNIDDEIVRIFPERIKIINN